MYEQDKVTTVWKNHWSMRGTTEYDMAKEMFEKHPEHITVHDIEYHPDDGSRRFSRQTPMYWCKGILYQSGEDAEKYGAEAFTLEDWKRFRSCPDYYTIDFKPDFPGHCNHPLWFHNG